MLRASLYPLVLLVSGCMTSGQIRESGNRFEHSSNLSPEKVVACMGRAVEEARSDWGARWREGVEPGRYELIVGTEAVFIADAMPNGAGGSIIAIYTRPGILPPIRDTAVDAMKRC